MQIFDFFPLNIKNIIESNREIYKANLEEIRFRLGRPIILKFSDKDIVLDYVLSTNDLSNILEKICENSIYSYQNQICNAYITIKGGHRVGLTGSVVIQDGQIVNIHNISSLNFRIAKEIKGSGNEFLKHIIDYQNNTIFNTLIVSPPGAGKTTVLRDIIRQISNGVGSFKGKIIGLIDERSEISAMYKGKPQNDIGIRTDVLENISKSIGMKMLLRSMAPEIICADEIGGTDDVQAIKYIICSGVKCIFTVHANYIEDLKQNNCVQDLLSLFDKAILLDKSARGKIKEIYNLKNLQN